MNLSTPRALVSTWPLSRERLAKHSRNTFTAFPKDDGFLFGTFGAADAMFAPVVTRFRTFGVQLDSDAEAYCTAVMAYAPMKEWVDAAKNEPWLIAAYEFQ